MSNLAEKLPKSVQTKINEVEEQGRKLAKKLDEWVETNVPSSVQEPLRSDDGVNLHAIRTAATAAKTELVNQLRAKWDVIVGGKTSEAPAEVKTPETKKPAAKKTPARKAPAKRKPAARKTPARKSSTAKKTTVKAKAPAQPKTKSTRARKTATKAATKATSTKKTTTAKKNSNTSKTAAS